jgi:hypothetical protein
MRKQYETVRTLSNEFIALDASRRGTEEKSGAPKVSSCSYSRRKNPHTMRLKTCVGGWDGAGVRDLFSAIHSTVQSSLER